MKHINLKNIIYKIKYCPLCKCKNFSIYKKNYLNRYSEEISNLVNLKEKDLMEIFFQAKCLNCRLVYKKVWFKKKFLNDLYSKIVPYHPTGWDSISGGFSKKNFINKVEKLNILKKNTRVEREIISIIEAIDDSDWEKKNKAKLIQYITDKNYIKLKKKKIAISKKISIPKNFSRFSGFRDDSLIDCKKKKIGNVSSYGEIGCPLWGMLKNKKLNTIDKYFLKPDYSCFWGVKCKKKKLCKDYLGKQIQIKDIKSLKIKLDVLCIFNYLDHLINIKNNLDKIFKISNSLAIILEKENRGFPIQHALGINNQTIKYIKKVYKKKISRFPSIFKNTKYNFFLLH